jgi:predicted DNA-binding ribbon-helix-helix protein
LPLQGAARRLGRGDEPLKSSLVVQHAVVIDGHKTSISLEDAFWTSLKEIAQERGESLAHLVTGINAGRQSANLSSVLRVFVLEYYRKLFHGRTAVSLVPDLN